MTDVIQDTFTLMLEPVKKCNIRCKYCYSDLNGSKTMARAVLETALKKTINYVNRQGFGALHIIWHGGEPLLAGHNFFYGANDLIVKQNSKIPITQFLQTNGLLLDKDFCIFFKSQNIQVGISIDGPQDIHNAMRTTLNGKGTHNQVQKKIHLCHKIGLPFGLCMVVTPSCLGREREIFQFFETLGYPLRVNPVLPSFCDPQVKTLKPGSYGTFLCRLFDEWIQTESQRIRISPLDNYLYGLSKGKPLECQHQPSCIGNHLGVRPDSSLVLCSRFQKPSLGSIYDKTMEEIFRSKFFTMLRHRIDRLSGCKACSNKMICHGGCPQNAHVFSGSAMNPDPLCKDYKTIFHHMRNVIGLENLHG